jgi:hypothetical protein
MTYRTRGVCRCTLCRGQGVIASVRARVWARREGRSRQGSMRPPNRWCENRYSA